MVIKFTREEFYKAMADIEEEVDNEELTRASDEENIELAFKLIKHGCNILWHSGYDYDITDCLQGIIDNYEREKEEEDGERG